MKFALLASALIFVQKKNYTCYIKQRREYHLALISEGFHSFHGHLTQMSIRQLLPWVPCTRILKKTIYLLRMETTHERHNQLSER
jgi:hypothetical protein